MGTNFFMRVVGGAELPDGLDVDYETNMVHVGKRTNKGQGRMGFLWQGHPEVRSVRDWVRVFETVPCVVANEYGGECDVVTFMSTIVGECERPTEPVYMDPWSPSGDAQWQDGEGWLFFDGEWF